MANPRRAQTGKPGLRTRVLPTSCVLSRRQPERQGVHREVESEGHAENCRAVVEGAIPLTNRSAKGGARSSLHHAGEGATHPPTATGCVRTARQGRSLRDPRRTHVVPGGSRISNPISLQKRNGKRCRMSSRTTAYYLKRGESHVTGRIRRIEWSGEGGWQGWPVRERRQDE